MAEQSKLETYRDREATRERALYGDGQRPDYGAEATRERTVYGGDGRPPTWLLDDDDERRRRIVEGDH